MEEQRKKIGMSVLPSLHDRLDDAARERRIHLWQAHQQALEQYLGDAEGLAESKAIPMRVLPARSPESEKLHRILENILVRGSDEVRRMAKAALESWAPPGEGKGRSRKERPLKKERSA